SYITVVPVAGTCNGSAGVSVVGERPACDRNNLVQLRSDFTAAGRLSDAEFLDEFRASGKLPVPVTGEEYSRYVRHQHWLTLQRANAPVLPLLVAPDALAHDGLDPPVALVGTLVRRIPAGQTVLTE